MAWRATVSRGYTNQTDHENDDTLDGLQVMSDPAGRTFHVVISNYGDSSVRHDWLTAAPSTGTRTRSFIRGRSEAFTAPYAEQRERPPSEHLRTLIAQHHQHPDQWPILLDALQEEYPQLWDAIESHRAARAASEAQQYARAFAAVVADEPHRVTRFAADGTRTVTWERPSEIAKKLRG